MRRVFAIAAAGLSLAGCSSFSTDYFKSAPPTMQVQIEFEPARRRCADIAGAELQNSLLGNPARSRRRWVHGQLRHGQVPAGERPGPGREGAGRSLHLRIREDRSQSGGRGAAASRPAAEGRPHAAEETQSAQGHCCGPCCRSRRVGVPGAGAGSTAATGRPAGALIACTAPVNRAANGGLYRGCNVPRLSWRSAVSC